MPQPAYSFPPTANGSTIGSMSGLSCIMYVIAHLHSRRQRTHRHACFEHKDVLHRPLHKAIAGALHRGWGGRRKRAAEAGDERRAAGNEMAEWPRWDAGADVCGSLSGRRGEPAVRALMHDG